MTRNMVYTAKEIEEKLRIMAGQIAERNKGAEDVVFVGIVRRGVPLAERLADFIREKDGIQIPVGKIDITLYGADHNIIAKYPILNETDIPFSIDNKIVVLVDDILYTGKTIHTAIDALLEIGSPSEVQLAAFIDRGRRTFPISADYIGVKMPSSRLERVVLHIDDIDEENCLFIEPRK